MARARYRQFSITPAWNGEPVHGSVTVFASRIVVDGKYRDIYLYAGRIMISILRQRDHIVLEWKDDHLVIPKELEQDQEVVSHG